MILNLIVDEKFWTIIAGVVALVTFLGSLVSLAFTARKYTQTRRVEQEQLRFENYHRLIGELVGGVRENMNMKLDSQIAIVYELRNFFQYTPVTIRILTALYQEWLPVEKNKRLLEEINLTLEFLIHSRRSWVKKLFSC